MATFCITPASRDAIRKARKAGDFTVSQLIKAPNTTARREILENYMTKEEAKFVNQEFETALLAANKAAYERWARKAFKTEPTKLKEVEERINDVDTILNPVQEKELFEDFISKKLGVEVTAEEFARVKKFADELTELKREVDAEGNPIILTDKFGNPTDAYFDKRNVLRNYLNEINPSSQMDVLFGVIAPGTLLTSIKSPLVNVVSNLVSGLIGAIQRRVTDLKGKALNYDLMVEYIKYAHDKFWRHKTDIVSMTDVTQDFKVLGEKVTHSQGEGKVRALGRFYEDFIYFGALGVPDVATMAVHFADYLNIETSRLARQEAQQADGTPTEKEIKQRARDLMLDAFKVYPETEEGLTLRERAQAEALFYTFKNKSTASRIASKSREIINVIGQKIGTKQLGKAVVTFTMTPSNVLAATINYAGGFGAKAFNTWWKADKEGYRIKKEEDRRLIFYYASQQGLGLALAALAAQAFDDDEYMPDYFSASDAERALAKQLNIPFNSIKLFGNWVSFDYFGILAGPIKGILHARKYGDSAWESAVRYSTSVLKNVLEIPGFTDLDELFKGTIDSIKDLEKEPPSKIVKDAFGGLVDFTLSRTIPALAFDIAKSALPKGELTLTKEGIEFDPFKNIFGAEIKQNAYLQTFFGARVRQVYSDPVTNELERLMHQGELPILKELDRVTGTVKRVRQQFPEEYDRIVLQYGRNFKNALKREFRKSSYKRLTDQQKKEKINDIRIKERQRILKARGFPRRLKDS